MSSCASETWLLLKYVPTKGTIDLNHFFLLLLLFSQSTSLLPREAEGQKEIKKRRLKTRRGDGRGYIASTYRHISKVLWIQVQICVTGQVSHNASHAILGFPSTYRSHLILWSAECAIAHPINNVCTLI